MSLPYNSYYSPISDVKGESPNIRYRDGLTGKALAEATQRLQEHMEAISGDPTGSDPRDYLSPEDCETLDRIKTLSDHLGWPGAEMIDMRGSSLGIPVWTDKRRTAKAGWTKQLWFNGPKGDEHKGYIIGRLSQAKPTQPVAFCDDGLLRSQRGPELHRSKGLGWGRLPDAEILNPTLYTEGYGVTHVNAFNLSLRKFLLGQRISESALKGIDLDDFGLADDVKPQQAPPRVPPTPADTSVNTAKLAMLGGEDFKNEP